MKTSLEDAKKGKQAYLAHQLRGDNPASTQNLSYQKNEHLLNLKFNDYELPKLDDLIMYQIFLIF